MLNKALSFLLIICFFIPFKANSGIKTSLFFAGGSYAVKKALKSPKTREAILKQTLGNNELKKKAVTIIQKFIKNPKNKKYKDEAKVFLSQLTGKINKIPPARSPEQIRAGPGTVWGTANLSKVSPSVWKKQLESTGAEIPKTIGEKLSGSSYKSFDGFRKSFWKEVSKDATLVKQFNKSNQSNLAKGHAPLVKKTEAVGGRVRYEIHHKKPISLNGSVYNLDNLIIVSPKRHIELHKILK